MEGLMTYVDEGPPRMLHVVGEIDLATVDEFRDALQGALSRGPALVEMAEVTFIDVSGLRVILQTAASVDGASPLTLVNAPMVERLFKLIDMSEMPDVEFRG